MAQDINITSGGELEAWLKANAGDELRAWSRIIAHRAALRIFPLLLTYASDSSKRARLKQGLTLQSWRAILLSSLAGTWPSDDKNRADAAAARAADAAARAARAANAAARAANAAANAADAAANAADAVAYAAANAADAARAAADAARAAANAAYAARAAANAAYAAANAADAAAYAALSCDCAILSRHGVAQLKQAPLWQAWGNPQSDDQPAIISATPDWLPSLAQNADELTALFGPSAGLFQAWYEPLLNATTTTNWQKTFASDRTRALALQPDEFWQVTDKRTGEAVMDDIAAALGWKSIPSNSEILAAQKGKLGNKWTVGEYHIVTALSLADTDVAAANNPTTQKALASLNKKLADFASSAAQFSDLYGWTGFAEDYKRLLEVADCEIADLADSIWDIYDRSLTLASYLQQDLDLRKANPAYSNAALSADHRRRLADIVRSLAPFVRRFPSIKEEDENTANYMQRVSESLALKMLESAGNHEVITEKDRALMQALLAAMERNGLPGEKSGIRGYFGVRNMLFVSAIFVTTTFAQGGIEKSDLYDRVTDWIGDNIDKAYEMVADETDDIKSVVQEMIDQIENSDNSEPPTQPDVAILSGRRRRS